MKNSKYTSIEEVVSIPTFEDITISDDGEYTAYVKKTADLTDNVYRSHVWIYEKSSKKHYPITTGKHESSSPLWSPNNTTLAYLAETANKDDKKKQIFIKTFDENNGVQITNSSEDIQRFKWSPDGKRIYYTAAQADSEDIKNRKEKYGDFEFIEKEYKNSCLYYIDLKKAIDEHFKQFNSLKGEKVKEPKNIAVKLTDAAKLHVNGFAVAPNGKSVILVATPTSLISDSYYTNIYTLDTNAKTIKKLDIDGYFYSQLAFSPDGRKITYSRIPQDKEYYKSHIEENSFLEIYNLESGKINSLKQINNCTEIISWTTKGIFGGWQDKTNYLMGIISETGEVTTLYSEDICYIPYAAISADGENTAYIKYRKNETAEVYINETKITNESKVYKNKLLSNKELVSWKSSDGLTIEGVLSTPADFDSNKKYPLLLVVHGGPTWASFPIHNMSRLYPIEQFVEKGYIVLEPNYRGSSGYGNEFRTANYKKLGIGDYDDVISGVDMLIEKGIADKNKVGIMGWSQGGYISAFCSTFSDRFKAISVGAGISNWITYYVNTDITTFTREYLGNNPCEDKEIYEKTSPMTYINSACTPTLIQHGDSDVRVPTPNAYELFRGLKDVNVEAELVIYKGMGHSPNKPGLHMAIMEQNYEWFTKHIEA